MAGRDSLMWGGTAFAANDDVLSPTEAMKHFTVANGLHVKTFAADPDIVSISNIDVDAQGRVWACECVNYRGNNGKRPEGGWSRQRVDEFTPSHPTVMEVYICPAAPSSRFDVKSQIVWRRGSSGPETATPLEI